MQTIDAVCSRQYPLGGDERATTGLLLCPRASGAGLIAIDQGSHPGLGRHWFTTDEIRGIALSFFGYSRGLGRLQDTCTHEQRQT